MKGEVLMKSNDVQVNVGSSSEEVIKKEGEVFQVKNKKGYRYRDIKQRAGAGLTEPGQHNQRRQTKPGHEVEANTDKHRIPFYRFLSDAGFTDPETGSPLRKRKPRLGCR